MCPKKVRSAGVSKALHDSTHGSIYIRGKRIDSDLDLFPMDHAGLSNSYELLIKIQKILKKILRADRDVLKRKVPKMVISKKRKI